VAPKRLRRLLGFGVVVAVIAAIRNRKLAADEAKFGS
jgi:hypothetical protein